MIKKIRNYILLAAVALSAASCLDKLPEDEVPFDNAIRSVSDVNQAVIGIYDAFKSSALYSGNLTLLPDLQADFVYAVNGYTNTYGTIAAPVAILVDHTSPSMGAAISGSSRPSAYSLFMKRRYSRASSLMQPSKYSPFS